MTNINTEMSQRTLTDVEETQEEDPESEIEIIKDLRPWQKNLMTIIKGPRDDRTIYWIYDERGKIGKSQFCKYLKRTLNPGRVASARGKLSGVIRAIKDNYDKHRRYPRVIVADFPRGEPVRRQDYVMMEMLKDGYVFSGKYASADVVMNSPHIIVFCNEKPVLKDDVWTENRCITMFVNERFELVLCTEIEGEVHH